MPSEEPTQFERELLHGRMMFLRSPPPPLGEDWIGVSLGADRGLGSVVLARDSDGLGNALVPVNPTTVDFPRWTRRGIDASVEKMMYRRSIGYYIRVRCTARGADEAFVSMATDIVRQLAIAGRATGEVVLATLENHASIFDRASSVVSPEKLIGLMGELLLLRDLSASNRDAVRHWSGPAGGHHDFEFPYDAVEVKTRLASSQGLIHINGVEQLESAAGIQLWLVTRELVESESGESPAHVIRQLLEIGVGREALQDRLGMLGIVLDDPQLATRRYVARAAVVFSVAAGFPRIVQGSFAQSEIPAGVERIDYNLRVAALAPWRVHDEEWRREVGRIASTAQ